MNQKLLDIYEKCMKHNITISINYLLSDAAIEVEGKTLIYSEQEHIYNTIRYNKWISIHDMKNVVGDVDLLTLTVDDVFKHILNMKKRAQV